MRTLSAFASLAFLLAGTASADVVTVGDTGADFVDLQAAVDAAADGDTLLLLGGSSPGVVVDGRALDIVADEGAVYEVPFLHVRNIAADQSVYVAGLTARHVGSTSLRVSASAGSIRFRDVVVETLGGSGFNAPATTVKGSTDVAFEGCTLLGPDGKDEVNGGYPGFQGLRLENGADVTLYDCFLEGGDGGDGLFDAAPMGDCPGGGPGGPALMLLNQSTAFVAGCTVVGGNGGVGDCFVPTGTDSYHGSGGISIVLSSSSVRYMDNDLQPGTGSPPGYEIDVGSMSSAQEIPGSFTRMEFPTVVREGELRTLSFTGVPGDSLFLLSADGFGYQYLPALRGTLLIDNATVRRIAFGAIPGSGAASFNIPIPALPAGVQSGKLFLQGTVYNPMDGSTLTSSAPTAVLDDAF